MIRIEKYHADLKTAWDKFNAKAINSTLLFYRDFIEYHGARFTDHSLLFYNQNKLVALLPLHEEQSRVCSHNGLTFGGLIISDSATTTLVIELFTKLQVYLKEQQFEILIYKAIPSVYYINPHLADIWALNTMQARIVSQTVVSVLNPAAPLNYTTLRKRCLKKALQNNIIICRSESVEEFMNLVADTYQAAGLGAPTHTTQELIFLMRLFPGKIYLLAAFINQELTGGVIIFDHGPVLNLQYIAANQSGKKMHVIDLLIHTVINSGREQKKYLSFGTSKNNNTGQLSMSLLRNKESYGARTIIQDVYELLLTSPDLS